ncbi:MAG: NAD(P)H-binding protein [Bifidobacteriaceae bacterium]|jgi:putative NADH-flavin reductase|nr:NAD(P)H-binding protein [Bifidobacteriaceae bacterium]
MTQITVLGGTGYAGAAIVAEAVRRGHEVTAVARHRPTGAAAIAGASYLEGSVTEPAFLDAAIGKTDVVISALSPRGPMLGQVRRVNRELIRMADMLWQFRLGVILGAGSLTAVPGGPPLAAGPDFPAAFKPEADEMAGVLQDLKSSPAGVDWFGVSPAPAFGAFAPGEAKGFYRTGGDVVLVDDSGFSYISAPDLALAVLDEIDRPAHKRQRFTVAY